MAHFAPVNPDSATGKAAELLAQVQKSLGLTPNMTKVMANSPALLNGWLALSEAVAGGALPAAVRERLAISTAQLNGCEYCLSAHTFIGADIALEPEMIAGGDIQRAIARRCDIVDGVRKDHVGAADIRGVHAQDRRENDRPVEGDAAGDRAAESAVVGRDRVGCVIGLEP